MAILKNPRWERFAQHFVLNGEKTEAYRHAFKTGNISNNAIHVKASQLAKNPQVALRIKELQEIATQHANHEFQLDADYVLRRLKEMDDLNIVDILDDEGHPLPLKQWPEPWQRSVSSLDIDTVIKLAPGKDDEALKTVMRKLKLPDKLKVLEMIGRHVSIQAWKDNVEHGAGKSLQELLAQIRETE